MTKITHEVVADLIRRVGEGEGEIDHGGLEVPIYIDGWEIVIFGNEESPKYVQHVVSPDGDERGFNSFWDERKADPLELMPEADSEPFYARWTAINEEKRKRDVGMELRDRTTLGRG